ncbi:MAG: hypothetical protein WC380_10250 [Pedobacter sp.]|jgi:hypothetical protein
MSKRVRKVKAVPASESETRPAEPELSEAFIEKPDPENFIQTENMEVHKHPHHVMGKKKWSEYLLEFSMLFLAVFLGFLAEYMLEHRIEKDREKTFIKSFHEDLSSDEKSLPRLLRTMSLQIRGADSMLIILPGASKTTPANLIYTYSRRLVRSTNINLFINDRTNVQLRNSGGMRLIQNKQASDSIVAYYKTVDQIQFLFEHLILDKKKLRDDIRPLLDAGDYHKVIDESDKVINPNEALFLRSTDSNAINNSLLAVSDIRGLSSAVNIKIIALISRSGRIKKFIAKEYNL